MLRTGLSPLMLRSSQSVIRFLCRSARKSASVRKTPSSCGSVIYAENTTSKFFTVSLYAAITSNHLIQTIQYKPPAMGMVVRDYRSWVPAGEHHRHSPELPAPPFGTARPCAVAQAPGPSPVALAPAAQSEPPASSPRTSSHAGGEAQNKQ